MAEKTGKIIENIETDVSNQRGIVRSVRGGSAIVGFQRSGACEKCGACFGKPGEGMFVEIPNVLRAKPGQQVELAFGKNSPIIAALTAYGLPLAALIAGIAAGMLLLPQGGVYELLAAGIGLLACALVFVAMHLFEPRRKKLPRYRLHMVRILD